MNRPNHFEIYTDDPKAVQPFYQEVFGWKFSKFEGGPIEYWLVTTGDDKESGINGGMTRPREGQSPETINTIPVQSLGDTLKKSSSAAEKSVCRRWGFRKSAGWLTPKILQGMCSACFSRTKTRNKRGTNV